MSLAVPLNTFEISKRLCAELGYIGFSFGGQRAYFIDCQRDIEQCIENFEPGWNKRVYTVLRGQGWLTFDQQWCRYADVEDFHVDTSDLVYALKVLCDQIRAPAFCVRGSSAFIVPNDVGEVMAWQSMVVAEETGGDVPLAKPTVYLRRQFG